MNKIYCEIKYAHLMTTDDLDHFPKETGIITREKEEIISAHTSTSWYYYSPAHIHVKKNHNTVGVE